MAERPIFLPCTSGNQLVREVLIAFRWHAGMAPSQKKKNIAELHRSAEIRGLSPLLEVSTKSDDALGQRLSAFNLKVPLSDGSLIPLECAYQGSKQFASGGPFVDLFTAAPRDAKRDPRLQASGPIIGFRFEEQAFPLTPRTAFYDWLYLRSLFPHRDYLRRLERYAGFTDIEFNPEKSLNCQARSCATFVALQRKSLLEEANQSAESFIEILRPDSLRQPHSIGDRQGNLFST